MITATKKKAYASQQGLSTLERPRYSAGLLLEDDDLTAAVSYTRNMMRLMFKSLFGCGVICGMDVTAQLTCNGTEVAVTVGKGVALECLGDPIEIPKAVTVTYDTDCDPMPEWLWVTVCYVEKCCRPKDVSCSPDENGQIVQTRERDGFEVRVYPKRPHCACSCEPPEVGGKRRKGDCCDDEEEEEEDTATATAAAPSTPTATAAAAGSVAARAALAEELAAHGPELANMVPEERTARIRTILENAANQPAAGTPGRTPTPTPRPRMPELCDCYQEHFDGKCACGCCCPCVLVGKIHTTKTDTDEAIADKSVAQGLFVDRQWVRWIRPVLVGYYKCLKTVSTAVAGANANVGG
jgi:hypothetical protein